MRTRRQVAYEALLAEVSRPGHHEGSRLPPLKVLASRAGVSYVTMWRAVGKLRDEGVVRVAPRRGIELAAKPLPQPPAELHGEPVPAPQPVWKHIRRRIADDMLGGKYAPGDLLPPPKTLRKQYGVCHATLHKALHSLVADGVLVVHGRTYQVPPLGSGRGKARMVFIGRGDSSGNVHLFYTQRVREVYHALEDECSRADVVFDACPLDVDSGTLYDPNGRKVSMRSLGAGMVLGFVLYATGIPREQVRRLAVQAASLSLPLAALRETGDTALDEAARDHPQARVFSLAMSPRHGELMGRYLLALGHRKVAYIAPFHEQLWSRNRLEGLRSAFRSAGVAGGVLEYVSAEALPQHRDFGSLFDGVQAAVEDMRRLAHAHGGARQVIAESARMLHEQINEVVELPRPPAQVRKLFAEAARNTDLTAWVGANDAVAREALAFLRERGLRVPRDLSVAGFDDTERQFQQNLTSYNFNCAAVARAMLGHVLNWRPLRAAASSKTMELDGFINQRRTTAPAASVV
jgi:DNA-binding LacI/PurR family transcriptional regulator/DNA-binding transcriptional regulator YhcF (GntR family)